jgi:APA family basic amino acid/polyamine antiporter
MFGNAFAGGAVALGFAGYFTSLFPFFHPKTIAILICLAFTFLNYRGIRQSAGLNNLLVATKLLILSFFIILGMIYLDPGNFQPFIPSKAGVIYGACYIFFAFGGFARVSVIAEEVKDAEHTVPKAILLSLLISTVFYLLIGVAAVGLVGASSLASSSSPLATAMSVTGNRAAVALVSLGGLVATASVLLTAILGVSREAYSMARKNALPAALGRLHPVHGTPYLAVWVSGALMILMIFFVSLQEVVAVSTFGQLFYYTLANVSDVRLRQASGKSLVLPALGAISCLGLLAFLFFTSPYAWAAGLMVAAVGVVYYIFRK